MRYFDLRIEPAGQGIHPVDAALAEVDEVIRDALLHFDAFRDGSGVFLYTCRGDPEAALEVVTDNDRVIGHDLLDVDEQSFNIYLYVKAGEPAGSLMAIVQKYRLMVNTPIAFVENGILATIVGDHEMFRNALEELPDTLSISIEQVGKYTPGGRNAISKLTERQREVFEAAIDAGYYDIPRKVTQEDLAGEFDVTVSTIDEHLRKAEAKLLSALTRAPGTGRPRRGQVEDA